MYTPGKKTVRFTATVIAIVCISQLPACYYLQAARGHLSLMNQRRPVAEVLADANTPEEIRNRLAIAQEARNFAVRELLLPDNESYRSFADLDRDYVVWNVFAAREFSLTPKRWCFPVAGCVSYRGYFNEESARKFASRLSDKGYDVAVGGVSAYSTLGKFADPVLSTMMRWSDSDLVATIFHELAHQKLYVKNDTAFNESFATAVARTGLKRWLLSRNEIADQEMVMARRKVTAEVMSLVRASRTELEALYASDVDVESKRLRKREILDQLSRDAARLIAESATGSANWLAAPLNNAHLVSLGLYEGGQNAFSQMLANCGGELACFYSAAESLAKLSVEERRKLLELPGD
jgi:predicted aminopeptidase